MQKLSLALLICVGLLVASNLAFCEDDHIGPSISSEYKIVPVNGKTPRLLVHKIQSNEVPKLTVEEVVKIAMSSDLPRPGQKNFNNGWWEVAYVLRASWRCPFDDKYVWLVRHCYPINTDDAPFVAGEIVFIQDATGTFGYDTVAHGT